jgi:hypothetical protein
MSDDGTRQDGSGPGPEAHETVAFGPDALPAPEIRSSAPPPPPEPVEPPGAGGADSNRGGAVPRHRPGPSAPGPPRDPEGHPARRVHPARGAHPARPARRAAAVRPTP